MVSLMNREWIPFVVLFLTAGIVVGYAFSYGEIPKLQSEVSTLTTEFNNLNVAYEQLEDDYNSLNSTYNTLQGNYTSLNSTHYELQEGYTQLEEDCEQLEGAHGFLKVSYGSLSLDYDELQMNYTEAKERIADLGQMVNVLLDEEYYQSMKDDLENASETILVAMYSMIYDPGDLDDWANDLIRELVNASDRGVNVTVIIENRTYSPPYMNETYMDKNLEAYQYLSQNNVTVQLDNENDTDHMKLVIIDGNIVYVGSHNWSESGLYYNSETSVKIVSADIADVFIAYFETI